MRLVVCFALLATTTLGCRSVPSQPDPLMFTGAPACPAKFAEANDELSWRKDVVAAGRIGGVVLAASGPAVAIGGIAFDDQPATPPVEAFVLAAGLSSAGVATVILTGALADDAEHYAQNARDAYANACPG